jgi:glycosyltransferase involved in cell wall biosynthesis
VQLKHIYWFSHYNLDAPSTRYRAKYALEYLAEEKGISYSFVTPGYGINNIIRFISVYFSVLFFRKKNSLIVFQRIYTDGLYAKALKLLLLIRRKNTLDDLDDAEYLYHSDKTIKFFMKNCGACSVGSESLKDYTLKFNTNTYIYTSPIIPHNKIKKQKNGLLTIGWIGFYNTDEKFEESHKKNISHLFLPALLEIEFDVKFVVLGITLEKDKNELTRFYAGNKNIQLEIPLFINWRDEFTIYERITAFDIGISPLLDNEGNRAKSAFKLKQYFSCGVPAMGSSVGENSKFLHHGITGFICDTHTEYADTIRKIKQMNSTEYNGLSERALASVEQFSLDQYCLQLINTYN